MTEVRRLAAVLFVFALGFGVVACGSDSDSENNSDSEATKEAEANAAALEGVTWKLMNIGFAEGSSTSLPNDVEVPTLKFDGGQAQVFGGCNSGSGGAEISGDTIEFGPIAMTQKSCGSSQDQIEMLVTQVLDGEVTYSVNADGNLILERDGNMLVFTPE